MSEMLKKYFEWCGEDDRTFAIAMLFILFGILITAITMAVILCMHGDVSAWFMVPIGIGLVSLYIGWVIGITTLRF